MRLKRILFSTFAAFSVTLLPSIVYGKAYGTVATQVLNVRQKPSTDVEIVKQLTIGSAVEIIQKADVDGWFEITLNNGTVGYVAGEFISIHRTVGNVTDDGLRVRDYPSLENSKVLAQLSKGEEISLHYKTGDWYKISQGDKLEGFVHKDYVKGDFLSLLPVKDISKVERVTIKENKVVNEAKVYESQKKKEISKQAASTSNSTGSLGDQIVNFAMQYLGTPYVYGGNSLGSGVDCSGFVYQVMKHHGINLSRSSSAQYSNNGYHISVDELQKGDLVFYGYSGRVSHVGIYIGGGQIIHANDERTGVIISSLYPTHGKPFIGAKRVL